MLLVPVCTCGWTTPEARSVGVRGSALPPPCGGSPVDLTSFRSVGAPRGPTGKISRTEWREWARQKRELMQRFNSEKQALIEDNKRIRAALDPAVRSSVPSLPRRSLPWVPLFV